MSTGQVVAERYRLEQRIGRGAMGEVWRALHLQLDSPVAIKFLSRGVADNPEALDRFLREARSAAAVRSSHVVQIFDHGVDAGTPFIAMEYLAGEPLDARLAARGKLEPRELDKIFGEVARAVGNAHDLGVVHRDIKPANIFIAREGEHEVTKVLDFGIAKLIDPTLARADGGTHTGILLGTPNYMSPEQARGHRNIDGRSDLWSLGVLAFECVTGRHPFESRSLGDLVVKICTAEPLLPSALTNVPTTFDAWFLRAVSKDPEARFASATEMADALHELLRAEGLGADTWPGSSRRPAAAQTALGPGSSGHRERAARERPAAITRQGWADAEGAPERSSTPGDGAATEVLAVPPRRLRPLALAAAGVVLGAIAWLSFTRSEASSRAAPTGGVTPASSGAPAAHVSSAERAEDPSVRGPAPATEEPPDEQLELPTAPSREPSAAAVLQAKRAERRARAARSRSAVTPAEAARARGAGVAGAPGAAAPQDTSPVTGDPFADRL